MARNETTTDANTSSPITAIRPGRWLAVIGVTMVVCLFSFRRVVWCEIGDWWPWSWDIWSPHNSQHLIDPYSVSHFQHGLGLVVLFSLWRKLARSTTACIVTIAIIEAAWEICENTDLMIQRYREATISLDYFGDSIINSCGDYLCCLGGVLVAQAVSRPTAIAMFAALELTSIAWIRDSLLLNILMLVHPFDSIRAWQSQLMP